MSLESAETGELIDRYKVLILDYQRLSVELASYLEKYGKIRKELAILIDEFEKRKINIEEIDITIK